MTRLSDQERKDLKDGGWHDEDIDRLIVNAPPAPRQFIGICKGGPSDGRRIVAQYPVLRALEPAPFRAPMFGAPFDEARIADGIYEHDGGDLFIWKPNT